jgi:hypothetical protein
LIHLKIGEASILAGPTSRNKFYGDYCNWIYRLKAFHPYNYNHDNLKELNILTIELSSLQERAGVSNSMMDLLVEIQRQRISRIR